ncbi:MAG: GNAT family N-acetyltransferase [Aestuariivirgaceae bacterium]
MVFLRSVQPHETASVIRSERVYLRYPVHSDHTEWASLRGKSRTFLKPWEPVWPHDDLTRSAFRARVKRCARDVRDDQAYSYLIFSCDDDVLLGGATLSNVRRGVAYTASLGYWIGAPYAACGYMTEAVTVLLSHAFDGLTLNRVEAACLPFNVPSTRLLHHCGFAEEGYARSYLKINGMWQDHLLFAIVRTDLPR